MKNVAAALNSDLTFESVIALIAIAAILLTLINIAFTGIGAFQAAGFIAGAIAAVWKAFHAFADLIGYAFSQVFGDIWFFA